MFVVVTWLGSSVDRFWINMLSKEREFIASMSQENIDWDLLWRETNGRMQWLEICFAVHDG